MVANGQAFAKENGKRLIQISVRQKDRSGLVVGRSPRTHIGAMVIPERRVGIQGRFGILETVNHGDICAGVVHVVRKTKQKPGATHDVFTFIPEDQTLEQIEQGLEESYDDDDAFFEAFGWIDGDSLEEAEYQGRKVKLNKPMQGDVKKFKVYVKDPKTGNVKKVNFGHGGSSVKGKAMKIRKNNPKARKSFRARHNCDNPGPKTKARYWSCRKW